MNKQELIGKLRKLLTLPSEIQGTGLDSGHGYGIRRAIVLAEQLDEPEKPVVPQFVADWIEWCKKNKITLLGADTAICNNKNIRSLDASGWAMKNQETFAKAWIYGYEVKKEKLYTVEIPNPNGGEYSRVFLGKYSSGKVGLHCWTSYKQINFDDSWKKDKIAQLTEAEIKKDFEWAWQFAEEVEQCNQKH